MIVRLSKTTSDIHPLGFRSAAGDILPMNYDPDEARAALEDFRDSAGWTTAAWAKASGVSEATIRKFLDGTNNSLSAQTYSKLAIGAGELLGRPVFVYEFSPAEAKPVVHRRPEGWHLELIRRALCADLPEKLGISKEARWDDMIALPDISSRLAGDVARITRLPRAYIEKRKVTDVSREDLEALHLAALDVVLSKSKEADPSGPGPSPPPHDRPATRKRF